MASSAFARDPTYIIPSAEFKRFSKEKRVEYVRGVLKIFAQHEKVWNHEIKISQSNLFSLFSESAFAQSNGRKNCVIGARYIQRNPATGACSVNIPSNCGSAEKFECGDMSLNKCVPKEPRLTLSERCYKAALEDPEGLLKITTEKLEQGVYIYQDACKTSGDNHGCFFLFSALEALGKKVGASICDNYTEQEIIEAGNILAGNGTAEQTTPVAFVNIRDIVQSTPIGSLNCIQCHNGASLYTQLRF